MHNTTTHDKPQQPAAYAAMLRRWRQLDDAALVRPLSDDETAEVSRLAAQMERYERQLDLRLAGSTQ